MKKQRVQEKERFSFCKGIVKKYLNPKWFRHEALHTTSVLMESVQQHIVEHHYYNSKINPEFNKKIDLAVEILYEAYGSCNNSFEEAEKILNPNWEIFKQIKNENELEQRLQNKENV